jgi:hypothetical protein
MAKREHMVGEAGRVGVVFFDPQIGLMVEQPIEHMRRISNCGVDYLGVEGSVLVGDVGVEGVPSEFGQQSTVSKSEQ